MSDLLAHYLERAWPRRVGVRVIAFGHHIVGTDPVDDARAERLVDETSVDVVPKQLRWDERIILVVVVLGIRLTRRGRDALLEVPLVVTARRPEPLHCLGMIRPLEHPR